MTVDLHTHILAERWLIGAVGFGLGVAGVAGLMRLNVYVAERERDARWTEK